MTFMKIVRESKHPLPPSVLPPPLSINVRNSSNALNLDVQFQTIPNLLPLQMVINQVKENMI